MPSLYRILQAGYLPLNIPQPFVSASYARAIRALGRVPPGFLTDAQRRTVKRSGLAEHNLARVGQLRRVIGIPNPIPYYSLAREIVTHWPTIDSHLQTTTLAATRPTPARSGPRAFHAWAGFPDRPRLRARRRTGFRFVLFSDIQRFYPSFYTHSLAWALHGKSHAKRNQRNFTLLGNRLDYYTRQAQDGQSVGIPIGPDASWVLSEIVLSAVDRLLCRQLPGLNGIRAVDDYELYFRTPGGAESALTILQGVLAHFGMSVNAEKTSIQELPTPLEDMWPRGLREFTFRSSVYGQMNDLIAFFHWHSR